MPRKQSRFDITFGGNGYQLARSGPRTPDTAVPRPFYSETREQYAAARTATGAQGYANWDPQREYPWHIADTTGGYGTRIWEPGRFYYATDIDARVPNEIKLGPLVNSGAITGEDRIHDVFMRTIGTTDTMFACMGRYIKYWTDPSSPDNTSKDLGTGIRARAAATYQGTNSSSPLTYVATEVTSGGMPQPYQTFTGAVNTSTWAQDTQVTTATPLAALYSDDGTFTEDASAAFTLTLNSLVAAEDKVYVRGDEPFEGIKVDINADNDNATTLTVKYYNGTSYTAVSSLSDGTSSSSKSFKQDGSITWTLPTDWAVDEINGSAGYHVELTWNNNLDSSVSTTDITLIQRNTAHQFEVLNRTLYRIAKTAQGFKLSSTTNGGAAATWTTIATVSDLNNPVTNMMVSGGRLFIMLESGLRALAAAGDAVAEEIWPHDLEVSDANNGVGATNWRGNLWLPLRRGLYHIFEDNGVLFFDSRRGPQKREMLGNDSPVRGRITAVVGDDFYLYAVMQNESGNSYLLSYDHEANAWFPLSDLGAITSRKMWISDVGHASNPTLYLSAGDDLRYITLPRSSPNPLHDSNCRYASSGVFYPGQHHADFPREVKSYLTAHIGAEKLASAQTIKYEYRLTDDGSYTTLETFSTDPGGQASFTSSANARFIEPKITLETTAAASTPVMRFVQTRYAVRFPYKRRFEFAVHLADYQATRSGRRIQSAETLETDLLTTVSSSSPVELVSPTGTSFDVLPTAGEKFVVMDAVNTPVEWGFLVEAVEHQSTVLGTWARASAYTWAGLSAHDWGSAATV